MVRKPMIEYEGRGGKACGQGKKQVDAFKSVAGCQSNGLIMNDRLLGLTPSQRRRGAKRFNQ
jgi:hypothetical protein